MDFDDTPEEAAFRGEARAWLSAHARERTDDSYLSLGLTDAHSPQEQDHIREAKAWQAVLYAGGWAGISWPKELGGRGEPPNHQMIFAQEESRFDVPTGVFSVGIGMAGPTIMVHGSKSQMDRFLAPMLRGEEIWCQLFSEPAAGSDLASLRTRAVRDGDEYVVQGQKVWSSGAHYSDRGILLARTDPDAPKHQGITCFLLDMRSPGVDVRPLRQITGDAHFNEVFLDDVRVPAADVLGPENAGWSVAITTLMSERTLIGAASATFDLAAYVVKLAGRRGLTADPCVRDRLARLYATSRTMRYMGWRVQTALSRGAVPGPESSVLKLAFSQHLGEVADLLMAIQGPVGMLMGRQAEDRFATYQFLAQWTARIGGGTEQVQRNVISERVLGLPGEPRTDRSVPFNELPA